MEEIVEQLKKGRLVWEDEVYRAAMSARRKLKLL